MERIISTGTFSTFMPQKRVLAKKTPEIEMTMPEIGSTGPVRIGKLLEPIQQIINHPDRNRLMAQFFKDYK